MKFKKDLFNSLSFISGLPIYDEIDITFEENYNRTHRVSIWVRIDNFEYNVHLEQRKGGIKVMKPIIFMPNSPFAFKDIPIVHPIDKMFYKKYRTIDDFNVPYTIKKNAYKYDEGGGWYSKQDVYIINGEEFVNI